MADSTSGGGKGSCVFLFHLSLHHTVALVLDQIWSLIKSVALAIIVLEKCVRIVSASHSDTICAHLPAAHQLMLPVNDR